MEIMKYISRITQVIVAPEGEPIFCERATVIQITDEAAGEFIEITQPGTQTRDHPEIRIDVDDWPEIKKAIDMMFNFITVQEAVVNSLDGGIKSK